MKRIIILLTVLGVFGMSVPALSDSYGYEVDVDTLLEQEHNSDFLVDVSEKKIVEDVFDVENGNMVYLLLTTSYKGEYEYSRLRHRRTLHTLKFEGLNLKSGEVTQLVFPCNHSLFTGTQVLIAQYKTDSGSVIMNPMLDEWREIALGSPTHILK